LNRNVTLLLTKDEPQSYDFVSMFDAVKKLLDNGFYISLQRLNNGAPFHLLSDDPEICVKTLEAAVSRLYVDAVGTSANMPEGIVMIMTPDSDRIRAPDMDAILRMIRDHPPVLVAVPPPVEKDVEYSRQLHPLIARHLGLSDDPLFDTSEPEEYDVPEGITVHPISRENIDARLRGVVGRFAMFDATPTRGGKAAYLAEQRAAEKPEIMMMEKDGTRRPLRDDERFYRVLLRVVRLEAEHAVVTVPSAEWDHFVGERVVTNKDGESLPVFRIPAHEFAEPVGPGDYALAYTNLHAKHQGEVIFRDFEPSPKPGPDDGVF
jgi:hypothetical protein